MKQSIQTDQAPAPRGPYSQGIVSEGRLLFVSMQGPFDPVTGEVSGETFEEQATQVFANIQAIVKAAGASLADVVRVTVFLADWRDFAAMNDIYSAIFPLPYPARTPIPGVPPGVLITAEAIAILPLH
ncbi:MAG: Rid family detoxifying hydrolase [Chloroflexota bacterium]|nr:Rid family detoxifying hydrolase [Chloroflexota bacterium]